MRKTDVSPLGTESYLFCPNCSANLGLTRWKTSAYFGPPAVECPGCKTILPTGLSLSDNPRDERSFLWLKIGHLLTSAFLAIVGGGFFFFILGYSLYQYDWSSFHFDGLIILSCGAFPFFGWVIFGFAWPYFLRNCRTLWGWRKNLSIIRQWINYNGGYLNANQFTRYSQLFESHSDFLKLPEINKKEP